MGGGIDVPGSDSTGEVVVLSEPGDDGQSPGLENRCKSCDRYIGPTVVCPFCGHKNRRTSRITFTKNAALVIAIVGLLALHIWSMSYGTPNMNIEDLGETSNYAMVEISGVIPKAPVYYPGENGAAGTIYFTVDDGTQQVSVRAYPNPVVEDMLATGKIPAFGDRVNVVGNVYWYNAERGFILNNLDNLEIDRQTALDMTISDITDLDHESMNGYYRVRTFGTVSSWRKFDFALDISIIDENDNEISVYIPSSIYDLTGLGELGTLEVGMGLEVSGCLEYYDAGSYSKWEIIPATTAEIRRASPDISVVGLESSVNAQQLMVNVTVRNAGNLPIASGVLAITLDGANAFTTTVTKLGAGESVVISYSGVAAGTDIEIIATASVQEPYVDGDLSNNAMTITEAGR